MPRLFGYEVRERFWTGNLIVDIFYVIHAICLFGGLLGMITMSILQTPVCLLGYVLIYMTMIFGVGGVPAEPAIRYLILGKK